MMPIYFLTEYDRIVKCQQGLLRTLSAVTCSTIVFRFLKSVRLTWKKMIQSQPMQPLKTSKPFELT